MNIKIISIVLIFSGMAFDQSNEKSLPVSNFKIQLDLFYNIQSSDSLHEFTQLTPDSLILKVSDSISGITRTQSAFIPPNVMVKFEQQAKFHNILWNNLASPSALNHPVQTTATSDDYHLTPPTESELKSNKLWYVGYQTLFSTYTYGIALPLTLNLGSDKTTAIGLLAVPSSFAMHYYLNRNRDIYESHLMATRYFSLNALALSYMSSFLILGPGDDNYNNSESSSFDTGNSEFRFRVGSALAMLTYPIALKLGFEHGDRFKNEPGRINLQSSLAYTSAILSIMSTGYWMDLTDNSDIYLRIILGQTLATAATAHMLSYTYRPHEAIPEGLGMGLSTFAVFGFGFGMGTVIPADIQSSSAISSLLMAGTGAGLASGLWFFRDKYDTKDRAFYNILGSIAGAVTPFGVMLFVNSESNEKAFLWMATGGGIAGYALTRWATQSLIESPRKVKPGVSDKISFNLLPMPVPRLAQGYEQAHNRFYMEYLIPGITVKF